MNFEFSDELLGLQREVRKMLERESPTALVRAMADGGGDPAPVWNHLVDMGVTGMTLPETCGGNGLGAEALCLVAEEVGRQLSPVPLVSTMYLAAQVLLLGATSGQQQKAVKGIAEGLPWAFAAPLDGEFDVAALPRFDGRVVTGRIPLAADGMAAKGAVILAVDTNTQALCWLLADLDTASVERQQLATLDPGRPFAALCFNATAAEPLGAAGDAAMLLQRVLDRAAVWLAFEQLGGAEAALDAAVEYAKQRIAFGRLIGSYQAIKHKLADLYVSISAARVHCYYGAWAL
ncbi:MAG TPA: acyl-CoA dehydrogenase family protein, partial [Nevskiaceae bacterium]|nr:acyl-CoA dehydrogenase family protein [Nevskiaceae bacterium]